MVKWINMDSRSLINPHAGTTEELDQLIVCIQFSKTKVLFNVRCANSSCISAATAHPATWSPHFYSNSITTIINPHSLLHNILLKVIVVYFLDPLLSYQRDGCSLSNTKIRSKRLQRLHARRITTTQT